MLLSLALAYVVRYPLCHDPAATTYLYYDVPNVEDYGQLQSSLVEAQIPQPLEHNLTIRVDLISKWLDPAYLRVNAEMNNSALPTPLPTSPCNGPCLNLDATPNPSVCHPLSCSILGWQKLGYPCSPNPSMANILRDCYCQQV